MKEKIRNTRFYNSISILLPQISEKRIDTYSACAAFYIFMSFIPYILILLSTVKYLPFTKEQLLEFMGGILPPQIYGTIVMIVNEMYSRGIGILSVSIIAVIWASAKGMLGITKGLNEIFNVEKAGNFIYLRARSAVCTLFLMLGMILMLVIAVFGNMITEFVRRYVTLPDSILSLLNLRHVIMWFVLFVLFMFFFCVLPEKKIKIRTQFPGAAGASLVWILFTRLFSYYLSTFKGYSMYGSFAVILVTGIWLYTGMYIMFMGALINSVIASRKG